MRLALTAALLTLTAAGLGACGASDAAYRATYRSSAVESCMSGARSAPNAAATGIDFQQLCGCAVDAYMNTTSTEELRRQGNSSVAPPGARTAMMQCLSQMRPGLVPGGVAPAAGNSSKP
jgi:hypothetical protein